MCRSGILILLSGFAAVQSVSAQDGGRPQQPTASEISSTILSTETSSPDPTSILPAPTTVPAPVPAPAPSPLPAPAPAPASAPSSPAEAKTYTISVGQSDFSFKPARLNNISVGDTVSFEFFPHDHSVARAEFGTACMPYERSGKDRKGFWSETQYLNDTDPTTHYNVVINSTEPVFFYCAAPKSCTDKLMVGAINPNETQTLEKQIQFAREAKMQLAPGEPMPAEGGSTSTSSASPSDITSSASPSSNSHTGHMHGLSTAAIVGISVGAGAFLVVCAALFFFVGRLKSLKELIRHHGQGSAGKPQGVGGVHPAPSSRQSTFSQSPQSPQGEYPPAFGSLLPAYAGPHISMNRMPSHNDHKGTQPMAAELHSPTLGRQGFSAELEASNEASKWTS